MLISFDSRVPTCFDWNILSFIRVWKPLSRPRYGKPLILSALARSRRYGRSKLMMLYPVIRSGSHWRTNSDHAASMSASFSNETTCAPEIDAHVSSVNTFLKTGAFSPCSVTWLAIWITGSFSASGKTPGRPAHSMSNERMRSGAIPSNSPSGLCETTSANQTSSSSWQCEVFAMSTSPLGPLLHGRAFHLPAAIVFQHIPVT